MARRKKTGGDPMKAVSILETVCSMPAVSAPRNGSIPRFSAWRKLEKTPRSSRVSPVRQSGPADLQPGGDLQAGPHRNGAAGADPWRARTGPVCSPRPRRRSRELREHLVRAGVGIEADFESPQGGRSIYFRDPAGNSVEFAEPRIWKLVRPRSEADEFVHRHRPVAKRGAAGSAGTDSASLYSTSSWKK